MDNSKIEFYEYVRREYKEADRGFILKTLSTGDKISYLKKIRSLLSSENEAYVVKPGSEIYSYFLNEYRNRLYMSNNAIIVPKSELIRIRR